jgi:ribonuclease Z
MIIKNNWEFWLGVKKYKIDKSSFQNIKNGKDIILEEGKVIPNIEL